MTEPISDEELARVRYLTPNDHKARDHAWPGVLERLLAAEQDRDEWRRKANNLARSNGRRERHIRELQAMLHTTEAERDYLNMATAIPDRCFNPFALEDDCDADEAESLAGLVERTEEKLHAADAECERLRAALVTAKTELARWGWGDDHYLGHAKQDRSIEGTVAIIDAALAAPPDPKEPSE